jgi:zinc finger SWIM domain-containing protein 3
MPDDPADSLVILSDRQNGLLEGVERLFPESPHGFCLRHLQDNMHKEFKHADLINLLRGAARAKTEAEFEKCMTDMKALDPGCVDWLLDESRDPEYWADLYFRGKRYGHLMSDIAEAFNAKLLAAREMPILAMLEEIRQHVMGWFSSRRLSEDETLGCIVSGVAEKIQTLISGQARRYRYLQSTETQFEVKGKETLSQYLVNLDAQTCSCREWQTTVHPLTWQCLISKGYPCAHALAVLLGQQKPIKDYVKPYFKVEYFQYSYAGAILHPHTIDFAAPLEFNRRRSRSQSGLSDESDEPDSTLPPSTKRPPGRPKNPCIRTRIETSDAAPVKLQRCGRCQQLTRHNKRTCKEPIA